MKSLSVYCAHKNDRFWPNIPTTPFARDSYYAVPRDGRPLIFHSCRIPQSRHRGALQEQLRTGRPDRGTALGQGEHRSFWRQSQRCYVVWTRNGRGLCQLTHAQSHGPAGAQHK
jgi:hypothetical protein